MSGRLSCAVYTRKSTEEGLEQNFNSLDAQREAGEAYIASQRLEGWACLPDRYDDGGYSGGTLERPALRRLLTDIGNGRINVVVVYKIDRLSRSLMDFAKLVELFERKKVTFVSVTQSFNTTSSMGRLTLNVLLSFAQFEREIIGERVRDKIAASKMKGIWMGGSPPLGYDVKDRKLVINEAEAKIIRFIYQEYLSVGCVRATMARLAEKGFTAKMWKSGSGEIRGGKTFKPGALYRILRNRLYIGEVTHKDKAYPGEHAPVISSDLFKSVQRSLIQSARRPRGRAGCVQTGLLKGLIFDECGLPMNPTYSVKPNGIRYRYYSSRHDQHNKDYREFIDRIPAFLVETLVKRLLIGLQLPTAETGSPDLRSFVTRIDLRADSVAIHLDKSATLIWWQSNQIDGDRISLSNLIAKHRRNLDVRTTLESDPRELSLTWNGRLKSQRGNKEQAVSDGTRGTSRVDPALVSALVRAHSWKRLLEEGKINSVTALAKHVGGERRHVGKTLALAFLCPDLTKAILRGKQPQGLGLTELLEKGVSPSWQQQLVQLFGQRPV